MDPAFQSQEKEKLWTPLHSQYEFLAAVSLATSGNESEFYSKILDFPDCSEIKPIAKRLQKMANRAGVTIVSTPQTFSPESGVSKATLFFEDNTWKTVPATRKKHINIGDTLANLKDLNKSLDFPLYHLVSRFPKKVRVGLFGGVGEGKSTLVESIYGPNVSTKSDESGSQTSWIHEFNFTTSSKFRLSAVFVQEEEIDRLREECDEEIKEYGKLKETKNEVRSYFGNLLAERLDADSSHLMYIDRPPDVDELEEKYSGEGVETDSLDEYQQFIAELQKQRQFVESVSSEIPHTHEDCFYLPDLTIIDLPGSNDTNTNRAKMIEKIIGEVDVIIFVSNQRNNMTAKTIERKLFKYGLNSMESKRSTRILNVATFGDLLMKNGKTYNEAWLQAYNKFQNEANAPKRIRDMPYLLTGIGLDEGDERFTIFLEEIVAIKATELEALIKNMIQVLEQSRNKTELLIREIRKHFTKTIPKVLDGCNAADWKAICTNFWFSPKRFGGSGGYQVLGAVIRRSGRFSSPKRGYINISSDVLSPLRKTINEVEKPKALADVQFVSLAQNEAIRHLEKYAKKSIKHYLPEFPGESVNDLVFELVENLQNMYKAVIKMIKQEFVTQSNTLIENLKGGDKAKIEQKIKKLKELLPTN